MDSPTDWHPEHRPPSGAADGSQHQLSHPSSSGESAPAQEQVHRPPHGAVGVSEPEYEPPAGYGENGLTLLVRDPQCVFAFWEVTEAGWQAAVGSLPASGPLPALVLRVYDLGDYDTSPYAPPRGVVYRRDAWKRNERRPDNWRIVSRRTHDLSEDARRPGDWRFNGSREEAERPDDRPAQEWQVDDARGCAEFTVAGAPSWYVYTDTPGLVLAAEIGAKQGDAFIAVARSGPVATPPGRPSDDVDFDWMVVEHVYELLSRAAGDPGGSPAFHTEWSRRRRVVVGPGFGAAGIDVSFSPGFAAAFSPGFEAGFSPGFSIGFSPGVSAGFTPGCTAGFSPGFVAGFSPGAAPGSSPGLTSKHAPGFSRGFTSNRAPGFGQGVSPERSPGCSPE